MSKKREMPPSSPSRRPPAYPQPTTAPAPAAPAPATLTATRGRVQPSMASRAPVPPPPQGKFPAAPAPLSRTSGVVVQPLGLKILSVGGILHASLVLMAVVVVAVMALGGDARLAMMIKTLRQSTGVWSWTLFAGATAFVLGFVMLYNAIGTLSLTPWSLRTSKLWASVWLALATATLLVNLAWTYPMLKQAMPHHFSFGRLLIVTWLHIFAGILWPGIVLFYMNTRAVKQLYTRLAGGAAAM